MPCNLVGSPVRGLDCFGRDTFVDLVWEKLSAGHVILAAPRRFGKTSILYRLIDAPRWNYRLVHCDVEHFTEPADFLTALVVQMVQHDALADTARALSFAPRAIGKLLRNNVDQLEIFKLKVKLKERIRPRWQESGEELFHAIARTTEKVVFILDEFAVMIDGMAATQESTGQARTLLRWLRGLRQTPRLRNVRFLIAGSIGIGHVLARIGETTAINDFEQLKLEPFPASVADEFLRELSASHSVPLAAPVREEVLRLVGTAVPYFLQIMFSEIHKAHRQDGSEATVRSVQGMYHNRVLGVDCKTYFDHYYGRLRTYYSPEETQAARRILRDLAVVGPLRRDACYQLYREQATKADVESFNGLMANLENDFYVTFDAPSGAYQFASKLLRDWWLRHYGMEG